ncbi:MAG: hypothetical protein NVS2B14_05970 [Chamaesiphon sp.]
MSSALGTPASDSKLAEKLPLRILLADDNLINQKVGLQALKYLGYRADVANNGLEVLDLLNRQTYDAILMDMQMPKMDGVEATRRICQKWRPPERPRIIAVTSNTMQEHKDLCLQAGMDDYLSKPLRLDELSQALSRCQPREL